MRRNLAIFHASHYPGTDSLMVFQKWSKSAQHKRPKGRVVFLTPPQNILYRLVEPMGRFLQKIYAIPHCRFVRIESDLGAL